MIVAVGVCGGVHGNWNCGGGSDYNFGHVSEEK